MTTFAQLHDCHSCNDERSLVQKKKITLQRKLPEKCIFVAERRWNKS